MKNFYKNNKELLEITLGAVAITGIFLQIEIDSIYLRELQVTLLLSMLVLIVIILFRAAVSIEKDIESFKIKFLKDITQWIVIIFLFQILYNILFFIKDSFSKELLSMFWIIKLSLFFVFLGFYVSEVQENRRFGSNSPDVISKIYGFLVNFSYLPVLYFIFYFLTYTLLRVGFKFSLFEIFTEVLSIIENRIFISIVIFSFFIEFLFLFTKNHKNKKQIPAKL